MLENATGQLVGIEIKAAATVTKNNFKSLQVLAEIAAEKFIAGIVLYLGETVVPFGDNLFALPVNLLWSNQ